LRVLGTKYLHSAYARNAINTLPQYEGSIESPKKHANSSTD